MGIEALASIHAVCLSISLVYIISVLNLQVFSSFATPYLLTFMKSDTLSPRGLSFAILYEENITDEQIISSYYKLIIRAVYMACEKC